MNCIFNNNVYQSTEARANALAFLFSNRFINIGSYKGENEEDI